MERDNDDGDDDDDHDVRWIGDFSLFAEGFDL